MPAGNGKLEPQPPAISVTLSRESSGSGVDASQVLTPTASRGSAGSREGNAPLVNTAGQQKRPTSLKRLTGLPKGLKLNLKKGSNRAIRPSDPMAAPLGLLCVRVIAARNLTSKDRNGKSDPWLLIKVGDCRKESDVVKASLNPVWGQPDGISKSALASDGSTDREAFVVAPVWTDTLSAIRIEIILWDKDSLKKDEYLGEVNLGWEEMAEIFRDSIPVAYSSPDNKPFWRTVTSSKGKSKVSGDVLIKVGWLAPPANDLDKTASGSSDKSVIAEPAGLALASKATILASRTSLARYAHEHPLSQNDTSLILKAVTDQLNQLVPADADQKVKSMNEQEESQETGKPSGRRLGWARLRRKRSETLQERVWAAPPNESVGTMRLDETPHGALSNELAAVNTGSSSDSSSPGEDYGEDDDEGSDVALYSKDDASATSEASSIDDLDDLEANLGPDDYFNISLGMQDAPSGRKTSPEAQFMPDSTAPVHEPTPTTPDVNEKKKKSLFPKVFKRTSSSKSVDRMNATTLKPDLLSHDSFVSDTGSAGPSEPPSGATTPNAFRRKKFTRRKVYLNTDDFGQIGAINLDEQGKGKKKKTYKHQRKAAKTGRRRKSSHPPSSGLGGYSISTGASQDDFLGVVFVEVKGANNLPRWRNVTRTGWDMDPFCIISFGQKIFRTRVIRHSRNPVWDERLFFHVKRHEHAFQILFTLFDWDKMSSNDYVGEVPLLLNELNNKAAKPDSENGIFPVTADGKIIGDDLHDYVLALGSRSAELEDTAKEQPTITVRAKFTPYSALRQRFWRTYLKQYDTDDSGTWSYVELYSMLDSLGATLTRATIDSFFTRFGKSPEGALTAEEAIICLEDELTKPRSEKREIDSSPSEPSESKSGSTTPLSEMTGLALADNALDGPLRFTGEALAGGPARGVPYKETILEDTMKEVGHAAPGTNTPSSSAPGQTTSLTPVSRTGSVSPADAPSSGNQSDSPEAHELERVINIQTCPLCHKKLSKKAEVDMVSHVAVCASQDWSSLDSLTVANFVSTSQAQRKWLTKLVTKVSHGSYKLGADSANILVQDRMTGQMLEEKMQVYVRLGIRLWYRAAGSSSRMEANRIKKLLRSMTLKQGIKFDSPESVAEIPRFIAYHKLDTREILDPIDSFKTFNSFFYRKLKPEARPVENPDDPRTLVSGADCRMTAFQTVSDATSIWIKGRNFSIKRLLGDEYKDDASKFEGGSLCIFRLAPQDYHRYHSCVDATIGKMSYISGEYYTVNPIAIRSSLDVYAENARVIVPMDSPEFGRVYNACIGAMMVGSIKFTKKEGDAVKRGEEYGYFAFGGSTIVCLFEPNTVQFDNDILQNSAACIETLVRVGMKIGKSIRK